MNNYAIISEFNPFHNGHKLLVEAAKQRGADTITSIMSGSFLQRGEPAILSKYARTECALNNGIDLVIELPIIYANSSANRFAYGGVNTACEAGIIDKLIFGSECGDIEKLKKVVEILESSEYNFLLKKELSTGSNYAKSSTEAMKMISNTYSDILKSANNTLGIEYIKTLKYTKSKIIPETILREGVKHDADEIYNNIASASNIRKLIYKGEKYKYEDLIPKESNEIITREIELGRILDTIKLENSLYYKLITMNKDAIKQLPDISEGLENRIYKAIRKQTNIADIIEEVSTKRYTKARIRRILMNAYIGVTNNSMSSEIPYIRILGFNEKGKELIKAMKNNTTIPIITKVSDSQKHMTQKQLEVLNLDILANDLQSINFKKNTSIGEDYYTSHIKV